MCPLGCDTVTQGDCIGKDTQEQLKSKHCRESSMFFLLLINTLPSYLKAFYLV